MATLSKDKLSFGEISVTGDGVKTIGQILAELGTLLANASVGKLKASSYVTLGSEREIFRFDYRTSQGLVYFSSTSLHNNELQVENVFFDLTNASYSGKYMGYVSSTGTITDYSSIVSGSGTVYTLHF